MVAELIMMIKISLWKSLWWWDQLRHDNNFCRKSLWWWKVKIVVVENHCDGGMCFIMIMIFWKNYCGLGVKRLGHGMIQLQTTRLQLTFLVFATFIIIQLCCYLETPRKSDEISVTFLQTYNQRTLLFSVAAWQNCTTNTFLYLLIKTTVRNMTFGSISSCCT